jgi:RNA polymerase sigma-70 factor (ECF subfamily)
MMSSVGRINVDPAARDDVFDAARQGDPAARWGALEACRAYLRLVVGVKGRRRGDGGPDTSDLVQNTILDGWRGFAQFRGRTPGQLRAWLRVILIHSLIKTRQRRGHVRVGLGGEPAELAGAITPPSAVAQRADCQKAIDAALRELPEHYRAAIRLRLWDQLSFAEIGDRLALSEDCARKLYGRAVARLREAMGPRHDPQ